ncbi:MAG: hypothetical protein D6729_05650 [Deltaproteobacteria bacterium]|nr:MAG: hypothetical protein D6729_05650 [Deltaproteobacteria bacterium]
MLYDGACGEAGAPCGGIAGLGCNDGLYCQLADCTQPDAEGTCSVHPAICPTQPEWVCGCDGQNYLNACQAAAAGVSVLHTGKCGETGAPCGGLAGLVCADGYYCNYATGCGAGDVTGTCQKKPQACPPNYDPVCGCDGKTYGNGCEAAAAGVSLRDTGPCN